MPWEYLEIPQGQAQGVYKAPLLLRRHPLTCTAGLTQPPKSPHHEGGLHSDTDTACCIDKEALLEDHVPASMAREERHLSGRLVCATPSFERFQLGSDVRSGTRLGNASHTGAVATCETAI